MRQLYVRKTKISLSGLFALLLFAQTLSADALLLEHCYAQDGQSIAYGEIKKEIRALGIDQIALKESKISDVASMYAGKDIGLTAILYIYDGVIPTVSLEMIDVSYIELLGEACSQVGYVFWIENFTMHLVPETKLTEHKNPNQRVIRGVIRR